MSEADITSGIVTAGEDPTTNPMYKVINQLYEAGVRINAIRTTKECGPQARQAVANYLKTLVEEKISDVSYIFKDGHSEKYTFGPHDYAYFENLADMLEHPEAYKGHTVAVTTAWEVLHERGLRFEQMGVDKPIANLFLNIFSMAARQLASMAEVSIGIPHSQSLRRPRYGLIP